MPSFVSVAVQFGASAMIVALLMLAVSTSAVAASSISIPVEHLITQDVHATRATIQADIVVSNAGQPPIQTKWQIEYATSEAGPWTMAASGNNTVGPHPIEGQIITEVTIQHLDPSTTYYVHVSAKNQAGSAETATKFTTTAIGPPEVQGLCTENFGPIGEFYYYEPPFREVCVHAHTTSHDLEAQIEANGANTDYQFEYATSKAGPYKAVPGASGTVTAGEDFSDPEFTFAGLSPETTYFLRVTVTNEKGTNVTREAYAATASVKAEASITRGDIGKITGTVAHIAGNVYPGTYETHWHFEYATSEAGPYTIVAGGGTITGGEAGETALPVQGELSGLNPASTYYVRLFAENVNASSTSPPVSFETAGPPMAGTFVVHALHGEVVRVLGSVRPGGVDTHYHFEYVSAEQFGASGWTEAQTTPELDAGSGEYTPERGYPTTIVGADLPGLTPGKSYDYRLLASSEVGSAQGAAQALTVPSPAPAGERGACPNEVLRTGPSASLLDCRAYEQITPVDKEGAQEIANYGITFGGGRTLVGEDGEHVMFGGEVVNWGAGPHDGQSPYFFTRTATGWQMVAAATQPETGVSRHAPQLFNPDLTDFAYEGFYNTGEHGESPDREFDFGPPGGPYTLVASVPKAHVTAEDGLVAGSEDFSKLFLQVEDHNLVESPTGTAQGADLYEYFQGQLRQVNVLTGGSAIGSCGAKIVKGYEASGYVSSAHAVSSDGSRVFFEAVPGKTCNAPSHVYMREAAADRTVDLGASKFFAANSQGSTVLLEKQVGETREVLLYETGSGTTTLLFVAHHEIYQPTVSADLSAIYFHEPEQLNGEAPPISPVTGFAAEDLYRYDIPNRTLRFVVQVSYAAAIGQHVSPDGRYYYFIAGYDPGAGTPPTGNAVGGLPGGADNKAQFYRYDNTDSTIECVSCASPFDPEPAQIASTGFNTVFATQDGLPDAIVASGNGDYAFFETAAALIPSDVDGEVAPEITIGSENHSLGGETSVSSDVYEWRKNGIDGCTHAQGCLSLITNGRGGFLNELIGSADEGRDVFFITGSQLVGSDHDTALDIYDARIGGGFSPPPPRPVECEGDACSTPFAAPSDLTPSSATFQGAGNVLVAALPEVKRKPKAKKKAGPKKRSKARRKGGKAGLKRAGKAGRARHATTKRRAGK